jgi:hypothetical protein
MARRARELRAYRGQGRREPGSASGTAIRSFGQQDAKKKFDARRD